MPQRRPAGKPLDMLDGPLNCAGAVSCGRLNDAGPELAKLLLVAFKRVSDIGRIVGAALLIDHNRQIAAHPDSIHVVEEEKAIAAKQILHIVLGGRNEDIDALVFEQDVESRRIEGRGLYSIISSFAHVVSPSVVSPLTGRPPTPAACSARGDDRANQFWFARGMVGRAPLYLLGVCALAAVLLFYTFSR